MKGGGENHDRLEGARVCCCYIEELIKKKTNLSVLEYRELPAG
jgi:hypothetical protein